MSLKSLPVRAPASKVLPRKRSVGERIVATLEFAALVRTLSRVLGRRRRRRVPAKGGLLAVAAGGVIAAIVGVLLARRRSGVDAPPPPPPAESAAPPPAPANDSAAEYVADADPVPAAVEAARKLDVDAPNEGATGDNPAA